MIFYFGMWNKFLILAGISLTVAGVALGAMACKSHGMLAAVGGAVLCGVGGLFLAVNLGCAIEVAVKFFRSLR